MMLNAVIFVLTVFFSSSHQQCFSAQDTAPILGPDKLFNWIESRNDFSVSLLKAMNKENSHENVIFSPSSIHDVLLLAYFGAANETERSLAEVLLKYYNIEKSEVWRFYRTQRLLNYQQENRSHPLKVGNKIFFSNKLSLLPCVQENLRAETEMIEYGTNVPWAINYINNWVANVTEGEIKDAVKDLSSASSATIVNAVFFKAKWLTEFYPNETKSMPFRVNSKESKATRMMVKTDHFFVDYLDDIKARLLKLPYKGEKQAMFILLPDDDLDSMIESLSSKVIRLLPYSNILQKSVNIKVIIPKYKARNDLSLNSILEKMGIGNNTLTSNADFSRFTGRNEVSFAEVHHQAVIEVDEEGTKASAVTVAIFPTLAQSHPPEPFICDRPFAYFIYDYFTMKILFMGTFRRPVESASDSEN